MEIHQVVCDGWDPQSRTVHGEHFNYMMIGKQHSCKSCKKRASVKGKGKAGGPVVDGYKFAPWHPGVLKRLPRDLVELFPAVILRRSAVDTKLVTRIEQSLFDPIGIQRLADHVEESHKKHFMTMQLMCAGVSIFWENFKIHWS